MSDSLLDFTDPAPLYRPPVSGKRFRTETALSQESRDLDLNNFDREKMTEDYSDSPHLNY